MEDCLLVFAQGGRRTKKLNQRRLINVHETPVPSSSQGGACCPCFLHGLTCRQPLMICKLAISKQTVRQDILNSSEVMPS